MKRLNNRGITLISLVITIIVLLILAGVTLNLTLGDKGIFSIAKKAAQNYTQKQEEELAALDDFTSTVSDLAQDSETGSSSGSGDNKQAGESDSAGATTNDLISRIYNLENQLNETKKELEVTNNNMKDLTNSFNFSYRQIYEKNVPAFGERVEYFKYTAPEGKQTIVSVNADVSPYGKTFKRFNGNVVNRRRRLKFCFICDL